MPPNSEQVLDDPMSREESLRMTGGLEPAHLALSLSGRLMRDFSPVVRVLARVVDPPYPKTRPKTLDGTGPIERDS